MICPKTTRRKSFFGALTAIVLVMTLAAIMACGSSTSGSTSTGDETLEGLPSDFQRMAEVWRLLMREHIDGESLDGKELSDGASPLPGFISVAPYRFLSPAAFGPGFLGPEYEAVEQVFF